MTLLGDLEAAAQACDYSVLANRLRGHATRLRFEAAVAERNIEQARANDWPEAFRTATSNAAVCARINGGRIEKL